MLPMLAAAGIGAALKMYQNKQQNDQIRRHNDAAAVQTQYSPWTKMGMGQMQAQGSTIGAGLDGAITGASFGQQFGPKSTLTGEGADIAVKSDSVNLSSTPLSSQVGSLGQGIKQPTMFAPKGQSPYLRGTMFASR